MAAAYSAFGRFDSARSFLEGAGWPQRQILTSWRRIGVVKGTRMPRPTSHILELARRGAEHRYRELQEELASLERTFPKLGERVGRRLGEAVNTAQRTVSTVTRRPR